MNQYTSPIINFLRKGKLILPLILILFITIVLLSKNIENRDWNECVNNEVGFSIMYPNNFEVDTSTCLPIAKSSNQTIEEDFSDPIENFKNNYNLSIASSKIDFDYISQLKSSDKEALAKVREPQYILNLTDGPFPNSVTFDEVNYDYSDNYGYGDNSITTNKATHTLVQENGVMYIISVINLDPKISVSNSAKEVYKQILSTFKIL